MERALYPGKTGEVRAYLARPVGEGKWPGVVVIHENRGLNAHIEDVTRRVALEGFTVVAPDALSPMGGTPEDPDELPAAVDQRQMSLFGAAWTTGSLRSLAFGGADSIICP